MARGMDMDISQLREFANKLENFNCDEVFEEATKRVAAGALANIIDLTPVGIYDNIVDFTTKDGKHVHFEVHTGKIMGGTLRRGWTGEQDIQPRAYVDATGITHTGNAYIFNIMNPVYYAPYVEEGHRLPNGGFIDGRHMLRDGIANTAQDIAAAETYITNKIKEGLGL